MPTNDDPKEKQVEIAQVWDLVAQVGYFSSSSKKDVHDFLHTADQAARDINMSSARVGKVMRFQLLKGKAKTFADTMLAMPHCYPNSNNYCEQLRVQGKHHRLFQEAITHRFPSVPSIDGEIRTHSSDEINSEDSVATVDSIASILGDADADPPVGHVPRVLHRPKRQGCPVKHRRTSPIDPVHPRRRHISPRPEIPDLCEIKAAVPVEEDKCLRHYLFEAFYKTEDPEIAHTAFLQSLNQDKTTSVCTWIWEMQEKQAIWHKKLHGTHGYEIIALTNI